MAKSKTGGDILVVDDTNDVSLLLKRILEEAAYSVVVAGNGPEALNIAKKHKPALILLDIMMPGMDGYEVCHKLKTNKQTRDIPVLFISALNDRASILKGFEAGGTDYITKPFNKQEVIARVNAQMNLNDSAQMFQGIFNNSPDAIFLIDPHSRKVPWAIVNCNKAACDMNGYTREELIGRSIDLLNDDDQTREDHDAYFEKLKERGIIREETTHTHKDGHVVQLEILATIVTLGGKEYVLGIDRNITERKKIQAELIAAKEKAEENDRLKSAFLANMSHEIRTPLNSILGFSELLSEPEFHSSPEEAAEYAKMIITSGNNLLSIINDILDISKIESGEVRFNINPFSPVKLLGEVYNQFKLKANNKGLDLQIEKDGIPATFYLNSDEGKVKQVLVNFVSNAIKFTNEGSITIGIEEKHNGVRFFVTDTGIGIPEKFHAHLFSRFRQAEDSTTRKYGGNGLGLAISKSLVELLGGTIGFESEQGKGSTFFFNIPG